MSILDQLASSLGRRDENPNQDLALKIVKSKDKKAIEELVGNLSCKDKNIQSDCIKVLYGIGESDPALIAAHDKAFLELLDHKNNRLVWGAMIALDYITSINPKGIYSKLSKILDVADKGSVITKDHAVSILIKLAADKAYTDQALALLFGMLKTCAANQLPMYAENAATVIRGNYRKEFSKILSSRLTEIEKESKKKRIEKVIKKLEK